MTDAERLLQKLEAMTTRAERLMWKLERIPADVRIFYGATTDEWRKQHPESIDETSQA